MLAREGARERLRHPAVDALNRNLREKEGAGGSA
jgi:hypothetical protein